MRSTPSPAPVPIVGVALAVDLVLGRRVAAAAQHRRRLHSTPTRASSGRPERFSIVDRELQRRIEPAAAERGSTSRRRAVAVRRRRRRVAREAVVGVERLERVRPVERGRRAARPPRLDEVLRRHRRLEQVDEARAPLVGVVDQEAAEARLLAWTISWIDADAGVARGCRRAGRRRAPSTRIVPATRRRAAARGTPRAGGAARAVSACRAARRSHAPMPAPSSSSTSTTWPGASKTDLVAPSRSRSRSVRPPRPPASRAPRRRGPRPRSGARAWRARMWAM